jgi:hypothetical protein
MMRIKTAHGMIVAVAVLVGVGIYFIPHRLGDDDMIREQVVKTLRAIVDVDTGKIEVSVENGEVTLRGSLTDHNARQIIIDEVKKVGGVKRVFDEMITVEEDKRPGDHS